MSGMLKEVETTGAQLDPAWRADNYAQFFEDKLREVRAEGRYRVFAELARKAGAFPNADCFEAEGRRPVTIWCSND